MEAWGLGLFMISAGLFGTLLWYPGSPLAELIPDGPMRRALMGVLMGLTAIGIIYSPWGQQSGAHINPAVTLTFWRLGKVGARALGFFVTTEDGSHPGNRIVSGGGDGGILVADYSFAWGLRLGEHLAHS